MVGRARTASCWGAWFKGIVSPLTQTYHWVGAGWHSTPSGTEEPWWSPDQWNEPLSSCSSPAHGVQPASSVPLLLPTPSPLIPSFPLQHHPWRVTLAEAALVPRVSVCHLLHWVLGLCISKQTPAFIPTLDPTTLLTCRKNGSIGASHFLWHCLWSKGETPALPHSLGMHPGHHAPRSPAGRQLSQFPCRLLFQLVWEGRKESGEIWYWLFLLAA